MTRDAKPKVGHRQRLKERFVHGDPSAQTDAALLELLLCYAIPQKDVRPLADTLLARFSNLNGVLTAKEADLSQVEGIGTHSAALLKLVDVIRSRSNGAPAATAAADGRTRDTAFADEHHHDQPHQAPLFDLTAVPTGEPEPVPAQEGQPATAPSSAVAMAVEPLNNTQSRLHEEQNPARKPVTIASNRRIIRPKSKLFSNAMLREAIEFMPQLPHTDDVDEAERFVREHLHFSGQETRKRAAQYIVRRMFPNGTADAPMRRFARAFAGRQELRDVCFYRLCTAELLEVRAVNELLVPTVGTGRVDRATLNAYLSHHFPAFKSIHNSSKAIVEALVSGGLARADRKTLTFSYRDILLPSFAFVLHSEYPEPGMYDIGSLAMNPVIRAMLWHPEHILPALYELRNRGLIAKVSEIDSMRQFTTRWGLAKVVDALTAESGRA